MAVGEFFLNSKPQSAKDKNDGISLEEAVVKVIIF